MLCLRPSAAQLIWRKSAHSLAHGECVEVAAVHGGTAIRDSTDKNGAALLCPAAGWRAFIAAIKDDTCAPRRKLFTLFGRLKAADSPVVHTSVR